MMRTGRRLRRELSRTVRVGSIPEVLAALRNTAMGRLPLSGASNVAAAARRFAARPWEALRLLGIPPNNSLPLPPLHRYLTGRGQM